MNIRMTLGAVSAAAALALSGCGASGVPGDSYQGICIDRVTQVRIADTYCSPGGAWIGNYGWAYYPIGYAFPPFGGTIIHTHYTYTQPRDYVRGGAPRTGGKVTQDSISTSSTRSLSKSSAIRSGSVTQSKPSGGGYKSGGTYRSGTSYKSGSTSGYKSGGYSSGGSFRRK